MGYFVRLANIARSASPNIANSSGYAENRARFYLHDDGFHTDRFFQSRKRQPSTSRISFVVFNGYKLHGTTPCNPQHTETTPA
jgi:hypothetical protein